MKNEKKTFESAEIEIVRLDCDMLLNSAGTLQEELWQSFDFSQL